MRQGAVLAAVFMAGAAAAQDALYVEVGAQCAGTDAALAQDGRAHLRIRTEDGGQSFDLRSGELRCAAFFPATTLQLSGGDLTFLGDCGHDLAPDGTPRDRSLALMIYNIASETRVSVIVSEPLPLRVFQLGLCR